MILKKLYIKLQKNKRLVKRKRFNYFLISEISVYLEECTSVGVITKPKPGGNYE